MAHGANRTLDVTPHSDGSERNRCGGLHRITARRLLVRTINNDESSRIFVSSSIPAREFRKVRYGGTRMAGTLVLGKQQAAFEARYLRKWYRNQPQ
jgi:hypothetical protein